MTLGGHVTEGESARVLKASGGQQSLQGLGGGVGLREPEGRRAFQNGSPLRVPVRPTGELEVEAGAKPGWPQSAGKGGGGRAPGRGRVLAHTPPCPQPPLLILQGFSRLSPDVLRILLNTVPTMDWSLWFFSC